MPNPENLKPKPFTSENQPANRGRKKGTPNRATVYKRILEMKTKITDLDGQDIAVSMYEAIAIGQARSAMDGNTQAWKEIQDSLHGKQSEKTELSGPDGKPLETTSTIVIQGVKSDDGDSK